MREIGIMEVGGFQVGHAQDLEAATGCTVILCDRMSSAGLDVRGGGPASRESQILAPVAAAQGINAVLLTGKWTQKGVHTVEEFDPDPFLDALDKYGLPRSEDHDPVLVD